MNAPPWLISAAVHMVALIAATLPFAVRHREPSLVMLEPAPTAARQQAANVALEVKAASQAAAENSIASQDAAIGSALAWLTEMQHADGGWSKPNEPADVESTSLALLAFAETGQTHKSGKYREVVAGGLRFLASQSEPLGGKPPTGLRFSARTHPQRAQALATLAVATNYARTHDKGLAQPAQLAVNELCDQSIDEHETAEDLGWRFLALKETHLAYLNVPAASVLALKAACDERALAGSKYEPGVVLARLTFSRTSEPTSDLLEELKSQDLRQKSLAERYILAAAFCRHHPLAESSAYLQLTKQSILDGVHSHEKDVESTALRVMILLLRPPRHLIYGSKAAEEDFPL